MTADSLQQKKAVQQNNAKTTWNVQIGYNVQMTMHTARLYGTATNQQDQHSNKTANIAVLQRNKLYKALGSEIEMTVTKTAKLKQPNTLLTTIFEAKQILQSMDKLFY